MSEGAPGGTERQRRRTLLLLVGLAVGMFGFGFAMVPLYGLLCRATGIESVEQRTAVGGHSQASSASTTVQDRWVTVKLDTSVHPDLPWTLEPMQRKLRVHPGEINSVIFLAENNSGQEITAQALPSIIPWQATGFFSKLECFCFTQQTLAGNERKEMPLRFLVSPDLPTDVGSITLSYSIMRVSDPQPLTATK
jgi:cytochrome c oxidase assembly protein subunit 11